MEGGAREQRQRRDGPLRRKQRVSSRERNGCHTAVGRNHDSGSRSGSKASAASLPSAFFRRISTRPSASSSCFWHSRESATPSSKSFIASSSESWGLSSRRTTSSRRARERSKSGFFGGSGLLGAGEFTRWAFVLLLRSILAPAAIIRGAAAPHDALYRGSAAAAGFAFAAINPKNLFEALKPPLRAPKIGRGMQTAFSGTREHGHNCFVDA